MKVMADYEEPIGTTEEYVNIITESFRETY